MKKIIGFILSLLIVIIGCNNHSEKRMKDTSFIIKGSNWDKFEGDVIKIVVRDTVVGGTKIIAKPIIKDGKFTCTGSIQHPQNAIFSLRSQQGDFKYCKGDFILEAGEIHLDYNPDISKATISGGKYNEIVLNKVFNDPEYLAKKKAIKEYSATMTQEDYYKDRAKHKKYLELNRSFNYTMFKKFDSIRYNHPDPYARLLAISYSDTRVSYDRELDTLEKELGTIPEIVMLRETAKKIELFMRNQQKVGVGKSIKDFSAKDINGVEFHLSDVLKENKYVLVEFWASWCSPCRAEIPYMKKAYEKYKNRGFEIVSFTLDHEKHRWEKATKEEGIPWINVGDMLAYKSPVVKMYGVMGVPTNYLVDKSGTIIAFKLRREKLDQKLEELLAK